MGLCSSNSTGARRKSFHLRCQPWLSPIEAFTLLLFCLVCHLLLTRAHTHFVTTSESSPPSPKSSHLVSPCSSLSLYLYPYLSLYLPLYLSPSLPLVPLSASPLCFVQNVAVWCGNGFRFNIIVIGWVGSRWTGMLANMPTHQQQEDTLKMKLSVAPIIRGLSGETFSIRHRSSEQLSDIVTSKY